MSVAEILTALLAKPILEEMVFRLGLLHALMRYPSMRLRLPLAQIVTTGNLISSVLFGAAHWALGASALHASLVVLPSLVFGWAYERYRNVMPCMALHIGYNTALLLPPAVLFWFYGPAVSF